MNAPPPGALLATLLALSLAAPSRGDAQGTDARPLLREGFAARQAQRDADALRAFEAAWAIDGRASTLAQIGLAEHALGRWVDAERHLVACLGADDPWVAQNAAPLRASLAAVRAHLASLALEDGPAGAAVTLDGRAVATLPLREPLRVPAGTVVLRVTAAGHHPLERALAIAPGETLRESVALTPETPAAPPAPPPPPPPPPRAVTLDLAPPVHAPVAPRAWAPWVLIGVGGVSLATAATLSLLRAAAVDDLRVRCGATDLGATDAVECAPDPEARALHERATLYRDLSIVGVSIGATAAVVGVVWWIVAPSRRPAVRMTSRGAGLAWSF